VNQQRYKQIQAAQIILATSIPVFSLIGAASGRWLTAILGASVAILAGFQQLGNYNDLWTTYPLSYRRQLAPAYPDLRYQLGGDRQRGLTTWSHERFLRRLLFTPVVHQPTRTTANTHDNLLERICLFAGVFEQGRTTTTVWI
jgi:hypothetical protein